MADPKARAARQVWKLFWDIELEFGYEASLRIFNDFRRQLSDERFEILERYDRMPAPNIRQLARDMIEEINPEPDQRERMTAAVDMKIRRWLRERRKGLADKSWKGPGAPDYPLNRN